MEIYNRNTIKECPYTSLITYPPVVFHKSTFYKISYIEDGYAKVTFKSRFNGSDSVQEFKSGDAFIITPDDVHKYDIASNRYRHRDLYIDKDVMESCCNSISKSLFKEITSCEYPLFFTVSENALISLSESLSILKGEEINDIKDTIHKSVVGYLLGLYISHTCVEHNRPDWLNDFIRRLDDESLLVKPISEIVKTINYSYGYLRREFYKYMNMPIKKYVNKKKLAKSTILLTTSNESLENIAIRLGFTTLSNYINLFKNEYNISPGKYRKKNQNVNIDLYQEYGDIIEEEDEL